LRFRVGWGGVLGSQLAQSVERLAEQAVGGGFVAEPEGVGWSIGFAGGGEVQASGCLDQAGNKEAFEGGAGGELEPEAG
jgi:hypothetical protein